MKLERILSYATPQAKASTLHGPAHWRRVGSFGTQLCRETPGADSHVISIFAALRDTQRFSDGHDPDHGRRAAELALELRGILYQVTDGQLALLLAAIGAHADGLVTQDPTIGCCWDADRLDLPRCGVAVEPTMLSTPAAKKRLGAYGER